MLNGRMTCGQVIRAVRTKKSSVTAQADGREGDSSALVIVRYGIRGRLAMTFPYRPGILRLTVRRHRD